MVTQRQSAADWADEIRRLTLEHPLAWVVSGEGKTARATPLPLRPILDAAGQVARLIGHFPRANPQVDALRRDGRALVLFQGPDAYVSPSWFGDRAQAPTWNYAAAQFLVEIAFVD